VYRTQWTRTVVVLLGGVVLSVVVPIVLEYLLQPNANLWLAKAFTTSPDSPEWREIWPKFRESAAISTYVIAPLAGLSVGIFVGLFQMNRPIIVTTSCLMPEFLQGFFSDHARFWTHSVHGVFRFVFQRSLPFIVAVLAATVCHRLIASSWSSRQARSTSS
jgi:hypothetical protein